MRIQTNRELAQHIRGLDITKIPISELAAWMQSFGQSGRGTKYELIERLYHIVWETKYN